MKIETEKKKIEKFPRLLPHLTQEEIIDRDLPFIREEIVVEIRPVIPQQEFEKFRKKILQQELP